jgi:hypothetical protein
MPASSSAFRRIALAALLLALALAIPTAAHAASQIASGNYPDATVDRDGVTHVVWNTDNNGSSADVLNYCQIPLGGSGCTNLQTFTPSGNTSGGNHDFAGPHVFVETNGDVLLVTHRCCGTVAGRPSADTDFAYVSTDGGSPGSWTGPTPIGSVQPGAAAVPTPIAYDASLSRVMTIASPTGGIRFQAAALAGGGAPQGYTTAYAQLSNYNSYDASVVFVGPGKFAAAWADANGNSYFRTYTCTGNPCSNDPNNAASWSAPVEIPGAERPRLVTGANGTFLLTRDPSTNTYNTRSIDTNTNAVGAALAVGASAIAGNARDITEDANGILHTLFIDNNSGLSYRASANGGQQWGDLQTIVPGPNFQLGDLKVVARTVDDGYAGNAIWEDVDPGDRNPAILMQALPDLGTALHVTPPPGVQLPGLLGGNTTPPAPTPPGACQTLSFGAVDVIADVCFRRVGTAYVATGGVKINGLRVELGSGQMKFDPRARTITTSGASVTVKVGDVVLYRAPINWTLPRGSTASLGTIDVSGGGGNLLGFPLKGSASINFKNGGAEIPVHLGLPALFGGVTGDVTIRADNIAGIHLRELHVRVGDAIIGPLEIKDLAFNYDADTVHWDGAATLILPPQPPGPSLASKVSFTHGDLDYLQNDLTLPGPGIVLDPLGATYLKHIRFGLFTNPLRLTGGVTINAGPQIGGVAAVTVTGDLTFTLTDPAILRADGRIYLVKIPVGSAYFELRTNGYVAFGGQLGYREGSFEADARVDGWLYRSSFNLDAAARISLGDLGPIGGEVVFSSVGFAGCVDTPVDNFGAGYKWDGHLEFMFTGCDVGPFKAVAAAAQAGAPRTVTFERDAPSGEVAVQGNGAPPHVSLVGPGGVRVDAPASGSMSTPGAVVFHDPDTNTTYFAVKNPAAGAWQVVPQDDSVAVTSVRSASGLEDPQITAHVKKGSGGKRVLTYRIKPIPGQAVSFAEQGRQVAQQLGNAHGTEGSLRFTPADGPGGTRRIIAIITNNGAPRKNLTVASYVAPPPPKPATPKHLRATRGTKAMTITWSAAKNAKRYEIRATLSDGRVIMVRQKGTRLSIPAVATRTRATITVTGLKADNTRGRKATLKVAAKRAARRPAKRRSRKK